MTIEIALQPKQSRLSEMCVDHASGKVLGFGGPKGGGKTGGSAMVGLQLALEQPGIRVCIMRRTNQQLQDAYITPLLKRYPELAAAYRDQKKTMNLPGGSELLFRSAQTLKEVQALAGIEYTYLFVDQAEKFTEKELQELYSCVRWPQVAAGHCKLVYLFNWGGPASGYFQRVFLKRQFSSNEDSSNYSFLEAKGWDNVEWFRALLPELGLTEETFYGLSDQERFNLFTTRTDYGKKLMGLPDAIRRGYLYGDPNAFEGQYLDNWDAEVGGRHVLPDAMLREMIDPWATRWIAIDWGFSHPTVVGWFARSRGKILMYREMSRRRTSPAEVGEEIGGLTRSSEGVDVIDAVVLSPDAFAHRDANATIADQLDGSLRSAQLPLASRADNDRPGGWQLLRRALRPLGEPSELLIAESCQRTRETLPLLMTDPDRPEDCLKFGANEEGEGGDDAADMLRYGIKGSLREAREPQEELVRRALRPHAATADRPADYTGMHLAHLRQQHDRRISTRRRSFSV